MNTLPESNPATLPPQELTAWKRIVNISKDTKEVLLVLSMLAAFLTATVTLLWPHVRTYIYPTWGFGDDDTKYTAWEHHIAPADGLVMAYAYDGDSNDVWVMAFRGAQENLYTSNRGVGHASITFPVRRGDDWHITFMPRSATCQIRWFPISRK